MGEYRQDAAGPGGVTFAELRRFVQTAMRMDVDDRTPIRVEIKFSGRLKSMTITVPDHEVEQRNSLPS